jgi:hypothetical protein
VLENPMQKKACSLQRTFPRLANVTFAEHYKINSDAENRVFYAIFYQEGSEKNIESYFPRRLKVDYTT